MRESKIYVSNNHFHKELSDFNKHLFAQCSIAKQPPPPPSISNDSSKFEYRYREIQNSHSNK